MKTCILYVDDEPINLKLFDINLRKHHDVLTAADGKSGLTFIKNQKEIGIVVSDMNMPEMNGLEFIKAAKAHRNDIHYYILTGYDITPEIQQGLELGQIKGYFRKPIDA